MPLQPFEWQRLLALAVQLLLLAELQTELQAELAQSPNTIAKLG
jgi:hypothetical protein